MLLLRLTIKVICFVKNSREMLIYLFVNSAYFFVFAAQLLFSRQSQRVFAGIMGLFILMAEASMTDTLNQSIKQEHVIQKNNDHELTELINTSIKNAENYRSMVPTQKNSTNKSANNEIHAFLFISFSMPDTLIKQYLIESKRYHIPLVIRGLVHNSMKETQEKLFFILHGDNEKHIQGGIQINPRLFKQYAVHAVPALVIGHDAVTCSDPQSCVSPTFDIIYGNLSLKASLEKMADEGNVGQSFATQVLEYDNA